MTPASRKLLLIDPDEKSAAFMRHMLSGAGFEVATEASGKEGLIAAWRDQPEIIVCELRYEDIDGVELIQKLRRDARTAQTPILALTAETDPAVMNDAFEAGVDQVILKQADAVDLLIHALQAERRSERPAPRPKTSPLPGQIITFIGAQGGVGTSSICANLAHMLVSAPGRAPLVAVDLDAPLGSLAAITGASRSIDVPGAIQVPPEARNANFFNENLPVPQAWRFSVLPAADQPQTSSALEAGAVVSLLQSLRHVYRTVITDAGRAPSAAARAPLALSDAIVIVFAPDEEGVARARRLEEYFTQNGIDRQRLLLLSNRPIPAEGLSRELVGQRLGRAADGALPNMNDLVHLTTALHAPFKLRIPEEMGTLRLEAFAQRIAERIAPQEVNPST